MRRRHEAMLQWLRGRGATTVAEAAEHYGVSTRTIMRDLDALRSEGYAISASRGRGGGIQLDPGARLRPVAFCVEEVLALVVGMAMADPRAEAPFQHHAKAALNRLRAALPPAQARALRRLLRCVLIGAPSGGEVGRIAPSLLPSFERAFTQRRTMRFSYRDRHGRPSKRHVEPHGLLVRAPVWYLLCWDLDKEAPRIFRMDRVASARLGDQAFLPRPQLPLREAVCPDAVLLAESSQHQTA